MAGVAGAAGSGALLASGCAPDQMATNAQPTKAAAPVTLELHHRWDGPAREPIVVEQLTKLKAQHPQLTINPVMYHVAGETGAAQAARFMANIAAGTPPDVFMVHAADAIGMAERGALTFLDPFLTREKVKLEDVWFPAALPLVQANGKTFALTQTASGDNPYLFYNKGMFQAAGVDAKAVETWDGLLTASKTLTQASGESFAQIGYPFPGTDFYTWHTSNGGEILTKDGKKPAFNGAPGREALTYVTDAVKSLYGSQAKLSEFLNQWRTHIRGGSTGGWELNKVGILASGPWAWLETPKAAPQLQLGAARMPVNKANARSKQTTLAESVWTWGVGAGVKHPDDAWLLEKWMSYEDGHRGLMVGMARATMVKRVLNDKAFFDQNPGWQLVIDTIAAATPLPPTRGWDKVRPIINRLPDDVLSGKYGVGDALVQAERDATAALDEVYRT